MIDCVRQTLLFIDVFMYVGMSMGQRWINRNAKRCTGLIILPMPTVVIFTSKYL